MYIVPILRAQEHIIALFFIYLLSIPIYDT